MADDNFVRSYRSNDAARRMSAPTREAAPREIGGNDPLAELARLIGQGDPYADLERNTSPDPRPRAEAPASDWRATAAALARESMRNASVEQQNYPDPHYADPQYTDQQYADQQYAGQPYNDRRYADAHYTDPQHAAQHNADPHYEDVESAIAAAKSLRVSPGDRFGHYAPEPPAYDQRSDGAYADNPYDDAPRAVAGSDSHDMRYGAGRDDGRHADAGPTAVESENYFFDGAPPPPDQRFYDDPPRAHASNSLLTIAVLVGCGILGTAGAYGYRTYNWGTRADDAPIIAPDKTPIKIVPAQAGNDSGNSTAAADGGAGERVVKRQEEPITLSDPGGVSSAAASPRVVLPAPFTPSPGPGPSAAPATPTPAGAANEPKRVHTVAIRSPGSDAALDSTPRSGAAAPQQPPPPIAGAHQQSTKPAPQQTVARTSSGPLSIDPQAQPSDQVPPPAPRAAGPAPAAPQPPAQRLASVSNTAPGGGYVVQISSQRSEAEAQTSFHALQAKYPAQLGDREAIVRRADLGPKGVFYRAMVGPFGTAGDADQFCKDLQAAGGQCLVQRN